MRSLVPLLLALGASALAAPLPAPLQSVTHPAARWAVHVDSQRAVAVDYDAAAAVLFPQEGSPRAVRFPGNGKLRSPIITPEGRTLALQLAFEKCQVVVWDVTAGKAVAPLRGDFTRVFGCDSPYPTEFVFNAQFTPDGRFIITRDEESLRRWDARNGKLLGVRPGSFLSLNVSPDGRWVAATSHNRRVEVWMSDLSRRWKATPGQPADCLSGPGPWSLDVAWSPDSRKVAFSCDREARVWNVAGGGLQMFRRDRKVDYPDTPLFSPDGRFLVAPEAQGGVSVWQVGNGQQVRRIGPVEGGVQVTDVAVTRRNLLLAALSDGRLLRLNLAQPSTFLEPLNVFPQTGPNAWLSLAVSRKGDRLAVASGDGRVNVYPLPEN